MLRYWLNDDEEMMFRVWYYNVSQIAAISWNIARFNGVLFGLRQILTTRVKPSVVFTRRCFVASLMRRVKSVTGILSASL